LADSPHNSSSRKGKAVEHLIAAYAVLGSGGALNSWTSIVDDEGVDLVFQLRDQPQTISVQVKSRLTTAKGLAERRRFQTQVRSQTFRARPDLYMLFVVADPVELDIGPIWFVPSEDFATLSPVKSNGKHKFNASAREGTKDMWAPFLVAKRDLPARLRTTLT
jgi:hypothetical protein